MKEQKYLIFVPPVSVGDGATKYSDVIDWCYKNMPHSNILELSEKDVYFLSYETYILDIINEENDGMLMWGEDDWIYYEDSEIKNSIYKRLITYKVKSGKDKEKEFLSKILHLLRVSIEARKSLHFLF